MPYMEHRTYYSIIGDEKRGKTPLLALHGGPGGSSERLQNLEPQTEQGRALILYDQIGGGKSVLEGSNAHLWHAETWVEELVALREHLKLEEIHLLGHSWGGMLAIQYMIEKKPTGIKSLTLSSTMAGVDIWQREAKRLIGYFPPEIQDVFRKAEESGDYESAEFKEAYEAYSLRHVGDKRPPSYEPPNPNIIPREAYRTAWGPCEFKCDGTLSNWDYTDRLHRIQCPTLVASGLMDECTPLIAKQLYDLIPNSTWELFEYSRHSSYIQEKEKYNRVLSAFLAANE